MHELSIAISIVEGVLAEAEARGLPAVSAVHIKIGPLSGVVKEALLFAYQVACEDTPLAGSELRVQETPVVILCGRCGCTRSPVSSQQLCCSVCGALPSEVVGGRELEVAALEVRDEQSAAAG